VRCRVVVVAAALLTTAMMMGLRRRRKDLADLRTVNLLPWELAAVVDNALVVRQALDQAASDHAKKMKAKDDDIQSIQQVNPNEAAAAATTATTSDCVDSHHGRRNCS
jgi:hypothetical protein